MERKWLPSFAELIDRLSIHQLKEVLLPDHKAKYAKEMNDIVHDLDEIIKEDKIQLSGDLIRCVILLAQMNEHIWYNESKVRKGESQDLGLLKLTHGLNGLRNQAMNKLLHLINKIDRLDYKTDCLASEFKDWDVSFLREEPKK